MARAAIDHASLEYVEKGSGEPLVLIHGSASDHRTWHAQQDELAKHYRAIAYSRRYHWPNPRIPDGADYAMKEQVDDLRALLLALDAAPAHLVGHSYGGFLALLLALDEPSLVRTLVLAEPPVITLFVSNSPKPLELLKLFATRPRTAAAILHFGATGIGPATAAAKRGDVEAAVRTFGTAVLGREAFRRLSRSRLEQVRTNFFPEELLGSGFPPLEADPVRGVQAPTLLVTGERSPRLFHRLADALEELLPRVQRVEIEGASHMMQEDDPPAFNEAVLSFLAGRVEA